MPLAPDPILTDHLAWLGYVQPEGLVVSAAALKDAQAVFDRAQFGLLQRNLTDHVADLQLADGDTAETAPGIADVPRFLAEFLGWPVERLVGWDVTRPLPADLTVSLSEFGETLTPAYAFQVVSGVSHQRLGIRFFQSDRHQRTVRWPDPLSSRPVIAAWDAMA